MTWKSHRLSGWSKKSQNFIFTTKMVFPESLKFMNSESEKLAKSLPNGNGVRKAMDIQRRGCSQLGEGANPPNHTPPTALSLAANVDPKFINSC